MKNAITKYILFLLFTCIISSCSKSKPQRTTTSSKTTTASKVHTFQDTLDSLFKTKPKYIANKFDFPVGKPDAKGYYNAQKFTENYHLGDDWNGVGGGNSDLGDPIYAIANGYVTFAEDIEGGWGNVVRIIHQHNGKYYESIYAHCDTILIKKGNFVSIGTQIGTIGNVNGQYYAHLHLELRNRIGMDIGGGYSKNTDGFLDPTAFIKANR